MTAESPNFRAAPELSAILLTVSNFEPIRTAVKALATQTVRERVELIIVCPAEGSLGAPANELGAFHSVRVLSVGTITTTSKARVAAIRMAAAPVIALCEDHAYPDVRWAEKLIEAHKEPWAGVGPAFINANPGIVSWVAMAVDYGRWAEPMPGGEIDDIPGHNSSWKRSVLLELGDELETLLPALTLVNWDLRVKGYKLYFEPAAKVTHLQVSNFKACLKEQFNVARLFPALRAKNWPWYRRLFYACAMPLLLTRNLKGWAAHLHRMDRDGTIMPQAWPMLLLMSVVWGAGEILGYVGGIGRAQEETLCFDTNRRQYVNRRDRELAVVA